MSVPILMDTLLNGTAKGKDIAHSINISLRAFSLFFSLTTSSFKLNESLASTLIVQVRAGIEYRKPKENVLQNCNFG